MTITRALVSTLVASLAMAAQSSVAAPCAVGGAYIESAERAPASISTYPAYDHPDSNGKVAREKLSRCLPVLDRSIRKRRILVAPDGKEVWIPQTGITVGGAIVCNAPSGETSAGAGRGSNVGCQE